MNTSLPIDAIQVNLSASALLVNALQLPQGCQGRGDQLALLAMLFEGTDQRVGLAVHFRSSALSASASSMRAVMPLLLALRRVATLALAAVSLDLTGAALGELSLLAGCCSDMGVLLS